MTVTAALLSKALTTGEGWVTTCAPLGPALPCVSIMLLRVTWCTPGTTGLAKVTRSRPALGWSTVVAMFGFGTAKLVTTSLNVGSIASSKVKSTTRPNSSWVRFWTTLVSEGADESPEAVPAMAEVASATSATLVRLLAARVKLECRLAFTPRVISSTWLVLSRTKVEPVRSRAVLLTVSVQLVGSSASVSTTRGPSKVTSSVSPPSPATIAVSVMVKVGAEPSEVVTAVLPLVIPGASVTVTVCDGVTRSLQTTVAAVPLTTTLEAV